MLGAYFNSAFAIQGAKVCKRDRTEKPPIGTPLRSDGHWSVQGLVGAWAFNEGGGSTAFDTARSHNGSVTGGTLGLNELSSSTYITIPETTDLSPVSQFTTLTMYFDLGGVADGPLFGKTNADYYYDCRVSNTGQQIILRLNGTNVVTYGGSAGDLNFTTNKTVTVISTYNSTQARLNINCAGTTKKIAANYSTPLTIRTGGYCVGNRGGNITTAFNSPIKLHLNFNRALSISEEDALSENPWQIYEQETYYQPYIPYYKVTVPVYKDRTEKPPIGTPLRSDGHWSVQGLVGAWAFNEGGGSTAFDNSLLAQHSTDPSKNIRFTAEGVDFGSGSSDFLIQRKPGYLPTSNSKITIISDIYPTSTQGILVSLGEVTDSNYTFTLGFNSTFGVGNNGSPSIFSSLSPILNKWQTIAVSQSSATSRFFFLNGTLETNVTNTGTGASTGGGVIGWSYVNSAHTSALWSFKGKMRNVLIYSLALTPEQIKSLSENPWQIYEQEVTYQTYLLPLVPKFAETSYYPVLQERTSKPPLGTPLRSDGHWSVRGLVGAWAFNEGGGSTAFDAISNLGGIVTLATLNSSGLKFSGANNNRVDTQKIYDFPLGLSQIAVVDKISVSALNKPLLNDKTFSNWGSADGYAFVIRPSGGLMLKVGVNEAYTDNNYVADNKSHVVGCSWKPGLFSRLYCDGNEITGYTAQNVASTFTKSSNVSKIGTYYDTTAYYCNDCLLKLQLVFDRALTPEQVRSLSENPWQIYEPEIVWKSTRPTAVMAIPSFAVNVNGTWKYASSISDIKVNINGVWKDTSGIWTNISGSWKLMA